MTVDNTSDTRLVSDRDEKYDGMCTEFKPISLLMNLTGTHLGSVG